MKKKTTTSVGCEKCISKTIKFARGWSIDFSKRYCEAVLCECVYGCEECGGTGFIRHFKDDGYSFIQPCGVCGNVRKNIKLYNQARIPAKFHEVVEIGSFHPKESAQRKALQYVKEYVKDYPHKKGFLLMGAAGVGKTHLALTAISVLTLGHGRRCLFKDFSDLLTDLKESYTQGSSENDIIEPLIETEVLVIDELGKGRSNEWELNILDQIISKRYNASKQTLITTNLLTANIESHSSRA